MCDRMHTITFDCEVITPMFCGGSNPNEVELRPPSIKGALRFWWRAMHGNWSLDKLKTEEAKLFGGTEKLSYQENGKNVVYEPSKSCITIEVVNKGIQKSKNNPASKNMNAERKPDWYDEKKGYPDLLKYLAYGTYDFRDGYHEYIQPQSKFSIQITLSEGRIKHQNLEIDTTQKEVIYAMRLFASFGGIGQRSRNAIGSLKINQIDGREIDYVGISQVRSGSEGSYSHFSSKARLFKTKVVYKTWEDALKELGEVYRRARLETEGTKWKFQKRVYIASPLQQAKPYEKVIDRHAKPFFMNVRKEGDQYAGYLLYLPSYFAHESVDLSNKNIFVIDTKGKNVKEMSDHKRANSNFHTVCNEFLSKITDSQLLDEVK